MQQPTDILTNTINKEVQNAGGIKLGKIVELIRDKRGNSIEYLVLGSTQFFGRGKRYFAIPACSKYIKIADERVQINASKDDLQFARGVALEDCPKPNLKLGPSIFELFNYRKAKNKKQMVNNKSPLT